MKRRPRASKTRLSARALTSSTLWRQSARSISTEPLVANSVRVELTQRFPSSSCSMDIPVSKWRSTPCRSAASGTHHRFDPLRSTRAARRLQWLLAGASTCPAEPVERPPLLMCNAQHQSVALVLLECDEIWKAFDRGFADRRRCVLCARPPRKRFGRLTDSLERHRNRRNEFVPESVTPFLVPQRSGAKLDAGLRMEIDSHAALQVPSEFRCAPSPTPRSERVPPQRLWNAAPIPSPMPRRLRRQALPDWKVAPLPLVRIRGGAVVTLQRRDRLST